MTTVKQLLPAELDNRLAATPELVDPLKRLTGFDRAG